jgi:DNA-binding Lrp family transcriptional regulator
MNLDATDLKILSCLQQDGRISNLDLAEKIFLSPSSCLRRVRALEEGGVIKRYGAILDAEALGLELEAFVQVTMRHDVERWHEGFIEALRNWPEVVGSFIITGEANYLLRVRARNLKHYSAFVLDKLYKTAGVLDIRSNIVLETIKDTPALPAELMAQ